jgi:hypothetical protein
MPFCRQGLVAADTTASTASAAECSDNDHHDEREYERCSDHSVLRESGIRTPFRAYRN